MPRLLVPLLLVVLALVTRPVRGQEPPERAVIAQASQRDPADTVFVRAQRLVAEGHGDAGRAIVATQLAAAQPGSARYVEALYWRATLAATAADAERDYARLIVEFPLSRRAEDALIQLAQLQMARGDRVQALKHLERVVLEHPSSPSRARASYWMARVLFEDGNLPRACARLDDARRTASVDAVELRNQIAFDTQRCVGVDTAIEGPQRVATSAQTVTPAAPLPMTPPTAQGARVDTSIAGAFGAGVPDSVRVTATSQAIPSTVPPTAPSTVPITAPRVTAVPAAAPATSPARATTMQYTVQVAAYGARSEADALRAKLLARGYDARVVPVGPTLFRVRVGRYPTRDAAATAALRLKANGVTGAAFVTEAEPR